MTDFREKRVLGRTGLMVSRLGIGAGYGINAKSIEKAYHEYGVNYLYWGSRKKGMKEAIRNLAKTHRQDMVIAIQSYDPTGLYLERSLDNGLRELGIDYADIYILGWRRKIPGSRIHDKLDRLKKKGKFNFLAISSHKRVLFAQLAKESETMKVDVFMLRYNAAHTGAEKEIFPFLPQENAPGITSYTATRWGYLLRKDKVPHDEKPLSSSDCYRFVLSNPKVDLCMIGPSNDKEMDDALVTLEKGPLSNEEMKRIKKIGDHIHRISGRF